MRSLRSLAVAHQLGHALMGERDRRISLLQRLVQHADTNARYNVYFGEGRDGYDVRGRVAHESIFNVNDGSYRCPSTQQGYSPFTTWTRGLAWVHARLRRAARVPRHAAGRRAEAVRRQEGGRWRATSPRRARPPTSTSSTRRPAAFRTGTPARPGSRTWATTSTGPPTRTTTTSRSTARPPRSPRRACSGWAATSKRTARRAPARATSPPASPSRGRCSPSRTCRPSPQHQGLLLHAVYHRPNGWDHVPKGRQIPCGESCMWGDYHLRELALLHPPHGARRAVLRVLPALRG